MSKTFLIFVLFLLANSFAFAQIENYSAPVNWERYKVGESSISVFFPKMPVKFSRNSTCEEKDTNYYSAYAEEAVYQMIVYSKSKEKIHMFCTEKTRFGEQTFTKLIRDKRQSLTNITETNFVQNEREAIKFTRKTGSVWIFNDLKNKKIIELSISHREDIIPDEKRFVESIDFQNNSAGIEIGNGAARVLGDFKEAENDSSDSSDSPEVKQSTDSEKKNQAQNTDKNANQVLVIITKPYPRYTDVARKNKVQGTVTLRVTFLANGGIGNVSIVSSLADGLTEQAMATAYKMAFLPAKKNGVNYTVVKSVQFSFNIY